MTVVDLLMEIRKWRWECNHRVKDPDWSVERKHFEDGYNSGRLSMLYRFECNVVAALSAEDCCCLGRYDQVLLSEAQRRGPPWTYETMWIEWDGDVMVVMPAHNPKERRHE